MREVMNVELWTGVPVNKIVEEEAERLLKESKFYMPELIETEILEAGVLVDEAIEIV